MRPLALVLALLASPAAAQRVAVFPAPTPPPGDPAALCAAREGLQVCRRGAEGKASFVARRGGRVVGSWPAGAWSGMAGAFAVFEGDLDGDGAAEVVVADHEGTSNGLGVAYWTVRVFEEEGGRLRPALSYRSEEFGATGGSLDRRGRGRPGLLATEWVWSDDPAGRRGTGLYFVGRPFRYEGGRLVPAADRPLRARRFLNSFSEERGRTWETGADPAAWLADRRAETRRADPYLHAAGPERALVRGTVAAVAEVPPDDPEASMLWWRVEVEAAGSARHTLLYRPDARHIPAEVGPGLTFGRLGDTASGRLFPGGYVPADLAAWLAGRRVRLAAYAAGQEPGAVLWVE